MKNINYTGIAIFIMLIFLNCGTRNTTKEIPICEFQKIKTLFTLYYQKGNEPGDYRHYVLIEQFSKKCLDSAEMVNIALNYADTVSFDRPASTIAFYRSDSRFIPDEKSQNWTEVDKDCLVWIRINVKNKTPEYFMFYNNRGSLVYYGKAWKN